MLQLIIRSMFEIYNDKIVLISLNLFLQLLSALEQKVGKVSMRTYVQRVWYTYACVQVRDDIYLFVLLHVIADGNTV